MKYMEKYRLWCDKVVDAELGTELCEMIGNNDLIEDAFYRDLEFGTAGLRGVMGAGSNRMNICTVAKASQGLANYINNRYDEPSIAIAYDSRIKSDVFSKIAASVFASNGIKVHIWKQLMPVPLLSYAVRSLKTNAGVVITASHNPSQYNGYKVYGSDGCQITNKATEDILSEIENVDIFEDVNIGDFDMLLNASKIQYIDEQIYTDYIEEVKTQSVLYGDEIDKNISIVYSPLNGSGLKPVTRVLHEAGYNNITIVSEQERPDGMFPTCPYPNPEIKEAMELGIQYAEKVNADLLIATDPDCDRVGIAVKNQLGKHILLTGNQIGILLFDYICMQKVKHGIMPQSPVLIKSIVTTDLCERIADRYGVKVKNVLTGFKYIGEEIGKLEKNNMESSYIFGFEESYGYLSGHYVRDKDAVNGSLLICEMFCYYASKGISVTERLEQIYSEYGYCLNKVYSYEFKGATGFDKMKKIMSDWRALTNSTEQIYLGNLHVAEIYDYENGIQGLPKADVIKYLFKDGSSLIIRPSGTEPKIKVYFSIFSRCEGKASEALSEILAYIETKMR